MRVRHLIAAVVLAGVLIGGCRILGGDTRKARERCESNLLAVGQALHMYAMDYRRLPPDITLLTHPSRSYLRPEALKCPVADSTLGCDYVYLGKGKGMMDPSSVIIACDRIDNHKGGRHVLHLDGHVEWLDERELRGRLRRPENAAAAKALAAAESGAP